MIKPSDQETFKKTVIGTIVQDEEVQWLWLLISQDIDSEDDSQELLTEIIKLWTTVRGFSLAASWMEVYKQSSAKTTKKSTSLRKSLSGLS